MIRKPIAKRFRGHGAQKNDLPKNFLGPCYTANEPSVHNRPRLKKVANFLGITKNTGRKNNERKKKKQPIRNTMQKHL